MASSSQSQAYASATASSVPLVPETMSTVMPSFALPSAPPPETDQVSMPKPLLADHLHKVWSKLVIAQVQRTIVPPEAATTYRHIRQETYPYGELISQEAFEDLSPEDKSTTLVTANDFHGFAVIKGLSGGEEDVRLEKTVTFNPKGADELVLTPYQMTSDMDAWSFGRFQDCSVAYSKGLPRRGQLLCGFVNQSRRDANRYHFYRWFVVSQQFVSLWNAVMTKSSPDIATLRCRSDVDAPEYRPWSLNARRWAIHNLELGAVSYPLRSTYILIWAFVARGLGLPHKTFEGIPLWTWLDKRFV